MSNTDIQTVKAPRNLSYQFLRLEDADWRMFCFFVCLILLASVYSGFVGLIISMTAFGVLMWPLVDARRYYVYGEKVYNLFIKYYLKDTLWENRQLAKESGESVKKRSRRNFLAKLPAYPLRVDRAPLDDGRDIGLIWNAVRKTYSILVTSEGSDIFTLSPQDMYNRQQAIAESIKMAASYQGLRVRVGFTIRRRPYDRSELNEAQNNSSPPNIFVPPALIPMRKLGKTAEELLEDGVITREDVRRVRLNSLQREAREEVSERGKDVDMVAIVTILRSPRLKSAQKGNKPITPRDLVREKIFVLAQEIILGLTRATVHEPAILDYSSCEDYLRAARDVVELNDYYRARGSSDPDVDKSLTSYKPQYGIYVTNDSCVIDQTGFAVVRVTRLPEDIEPNLMPLLFTETNVDWLSRSLVSESSTGDVEYFTAGYIAAVVDSLLAAFNIFRTGPKTRNRRMALDDQQERLADQKHAEYFDILLGTASADPDQRETDVEEMIRIVNSIGGRAERVTGRSRQVRAALTATTGIACL